MLLEYFTEGSTVTQTDALMYVLGIGACNLLQVTIGPQFVVRAINCCHRWRAGVVGLLYKKVIKAMINVQQWMYLTYLTFSVVSYIYSVA